MTTVAESVHTAPETSSESRKEPSQRCPRCKKQRLARRPRQADERQLTRTLGKIIKIRPYRCSACKYETWKLKGWTASPLHSLMLVTGALLLAVLIGFMAWLIWQPEHLPSLPKQAVAHATPGTATGDQNVASPETGASAPPVVPATSGFRLESAALKKLNGHYTLMLRANQTLTNYKVWLLQDTRSRHVIDIPGKWIVADGVERSFETRIGQVDRVGIAEHADYLRIAIRLRNASASYTPKVQPTAEGLQVQLD